MYIQGFNPRWMCDPVLLEYVQEVHIDPYVSVYGNYEMPGIYQELFLRN